jgi:hypothetical protein
MLEIFCYFQKQYCGKGFIHYRCLQNKCLHLLSEYYSNLWFSLEIFGHVTVLTVSTGI